MSLISRVSAEEAPRNITVEGGGGPASGVGTEVAGTGCAVAGPYVFNLGAHTLSVSMDLHAANRNRLVSALWQKHGPAIKGDFFIASSAFASEECNMLKVVH
jgi:hypothetical protein